MSAKTPAGLKTSVSRALAKAGHSRSTSHSTRVRGWRERTAGFEIDGGHVSGARITCRVSHRTSYMQRGQQRRDEMARRLQEYGESLTAAGFTFDAQEGSSVRDPGLIVWVEVAP